MEKNARLVTRAPESLRERLMKLCPNMRESTAVRYAIERFVSRQEADLRQYDSPESHLNSLLESINNLTNKAAALAKQIRDASPKNLLTIVLCVSMIQAVW